MSSAKRQFLACACLVVALGNHWADEHPPSGAERSAKPNVETAKKYRSVEAGSQSEVLTAADLLGEIDYATDPRFVPVDAAHTNRAKCRLRKEAYAAFVKMHEAALKEGFDLSIVSCARSFQHQKWIWERKWASLAGAVEAEEDPPSTVTAERILRYTAMPGTSRHHWGTEIDLRYLLSHGHTDAFGARLYSWLQDHAMDFGFCQTYNEKGAGRPTGHEEEKWHWSYVPLSSKYLEAYQREVSVSELEGFEGDALAEELDIIQRYVLGVNPACLAWEIARDELAMNVDAVQGQPR